MVKVKLSREFCNGKGRDKKSKDKNGGFDLPDLEMTHFGHLDYGSCKNGKRKRKEDESRSKMKKEGDFFNEKNEICYIWF